MDAPKPGAIPAHLIVEGRLMRMSREEFEAASMEQLAYFHPFRDFYGKKVIAYIQEAIRLVREYGDLADEHRKLRDQVIKDRTQRTPDQAQLLAELLKLQADVAAIGRAIQALTPPPGTRDEWMLGATECRWDNLDQHDGGQRWQGYCGFGFMEKRPEPGAKCPGCWLPIKLEA